MDTLTTVVTAEEHTAVNGCPPGGCGGPDPAILAKMATIYNLAMDLSMGFYIPILILGLFGNSLSFAIMVKKASASSTYCYLSSLCVMDNLFLTTSVLTWLIFYVSEGAVDLRAVLDCNVTSILHRIPKEISAWLLVAVSVERLLVVYLPTKAKTICDVKRSRVVVGLLIVAICAINWHSFGGFKTNRPGHTVDGYVDKVCEGRSEFLSDYITNKLFWKHGTLYSYIPTILLFATNLAIVVKFAGAAWQQKRKVNPDTQSRTMAKHSTRMTIMGLTLSFTFLCLTLPSAIINLYFYSNLAYVTSEPIRYYNHFLKDQMLSVLYHLNHAINFALYCVTSGKFRADLRALFRCHMRDVMPSVVNTASTIA